MVVSPQPLNPNQILLDEKGRTGGGIRVKEKEPFKGKGCNDFFFSLFVPFLLDSFENKLNVKNSFRQRDAKEVINV